MAPLGVNKKPIGAEPQNVAPHIKLWNDCKHRLEVERQVTFEESGKAFLAAYERVSEPESRQFVEEVMVGAVEIFLNQFAANVSPPLLIHFEHVLLSSAKIISWELRTLRCIKRLELLGKILDDSAQFYQDKKTLINNARRPAAVRLSIIRELLHDGTFTLLLQMIKGQIPILEWSPADFAPPPGNSAPEACPLTVRVMDLLMIPAMNARQPEIDTASFAEAAMKEATRSSSGDLLKKQKPEDIQELHMLIGQVLGPQDEGFHEFSMNLWLSCFESDVFALRKLGLDSLIKVCADASRLRNNPARWNLSNDPSRASTTSALHATSGNPMIERGTTPSPSWDETMICQWLAEKKVLENLFGSGSQTHIALVSRSKSLLEHMAYAGVLGPSQIDMILEGCVGQHESSRGAIHSLMAELLLDLSVAQQLQQTQIPGGNEAAAAVLILKRATALIAKHPEDMFFFARKLMQVENSARNRGILVSRNYELQLGLLDLLWALVMCPSLSPNDARESEQRGDQLLQDFNDALRSAIVPLPSSYSYYRSGEKMKEDRLFQEFLSRCVALIQPLETHNGPITSLPAEEGRVWKACMVLKNLIQLHPDLGGNQDQMWLNVDKSRTGPEWARRSQTEFVEELDKKYRLSEWIVERITGLSQLLSERKIKTRLDLLRFIAERIRQYDCLDFEKISQCWSSLAHRNDLRLQWLQELVATSPGRPRVISRPVAERIFLELICGSSIDALGTPQGYDCFAAYFDDVVKDSLNGATTRSISAEPSLGLETLWTIAIQASSLQVAEKASQMLLVVQRKLETAGKKNGIGFIERLMSALRSTTSDERKRRCVKLALSYLGSQLMVESHAPAAANLMIRDSTELVIHHDDILLYSSEDLGKIIEKRFREKNGYSWYPGYIYDYNVETKQHHIIFADGEQKMYDMRNLMREGSLAQLADPSGGAEKQQYRMLSVVSDGHFKLDPKVGITLKTAESIKHYHGVKVQVSEVTTIAQVKSAVLDKLGRTGIQDESNLELQVQLDAPLTVVPGFLQAHPPRAVAGKAPGYFRYKVLDEGLPIQLLVAKFGNKLFLCNETATTAASEAVISTVGSVLDATPSTFISRENSEEHAELMRLVQDPTASLETRMDTWNLLMAIPTEQGMLSRALSPGFNWQQALEQLARPDSVLGQIYLLQVADRTLLDLQYQNDDAGKLRRERFEQGFFNRGVTSDLLKLFSRLMSSEFTNEWERSVSLRVMVRLLRMCVSRGLVADGAPRFSRDLTRLIVWEMGNECASNQTANALSSTAPSTNTQLVSFGSPSSPGALVTTSTISVSSPAAASPRSSVSPGSPKASSSLAPVADDSLQCALSLAAVAIQMELVQDEANHRFLLSSDDGEGATSKTLTDVLLQSSHSQIRASTYRLLLEITRTSRSEVFRCVLATLSRCPQYTMTCQMFFDFVNEFIVMGSEEEMAQCCSDLMSVVRDRLTKYTYSGSTEDPSLNGFLELCKKLVEHSFKTSGTGDDPELVNALLSRYLLAVPTVSSTQSNIATSPATRQRCFQLLRSLAQKSPGNHLLLLSRLDEFVALVDKPLGRGGRTWDFNFRTDDTRRIPGTFVGLVNQGATCYQNSVLQQLFMRKPMRDLILRAIPGVTAALGAVADRIEEEGTEPGEEPLAKRKARSRKALLVQLQKLFSFLSGSEQKFYNPRLFVNSSACLRLTDSHLAQNDCIEFYSLLMEYLEEVFKGRPEREALRNLYVCSMMSLTMRNCPNKHRSEKEESTFYIPLSIRYGMEGRALNSLDEALDEWSKSEHLTDLICEDCFPPKPELAKSSSTTPSAAGSAGGGGGKKEQNPRFDADQVKFITRFPPVLVLQLKRFDFDYETLQPTKLNHRVSFEQRLDLGRFTREAVLRQYEKSGEEGEEGAKEEPHVWYRLKGVVVHKGMGVNFGHYYSFVEDDDGNQWFKFDDDTVTPFDVNLLEEECFGGPVVHTDSTKSMTPAFSAAAVAAGKRSGGFSSGSGGLRNNNAYLLIYTKENAVVPVDSKTEAEPKQPPASIAPKPLSLKFAAKLVLVLHQWKKRAAMYVESKQLIREHEMFVVKENERAMRHVIAFAPDFLQFCLRLLSLNSSSLSQEGLVALGKFMMDVLMNIVLFAFSEKDRYEQWLGITRAVLKKSPQAEVIVCEWFIKKLISEPTGSEPSHQPQASSSLANWVERLLVQCVDPRSSFMFREMLTYCIKRCDSKLIVSLAEVLIKSFPKAASSSATNNNSTSMVDSGMQQSQSRYSTPPITDGEYFVVVRTMALAFPEVRAYFISKDVVYLLIRLLDEQQHHHQHQQQQHSANGAGGGGSQTSSSYPLIVVRDEKLCSKVVFALDTLVRGCDRDQRDDDDQIDAGFPLMPQDSVKALGAESLLMALLQFAPGPAKYLIPRLCNCSIPRAEKSFEKLYFELSSSQWPAKAAEAPYVIPDACDAWKELMISLDRDPNSRVLRENQITLLIKLVKEARKVAAERREAQQSMQASRTAALTSSASSAYYQPLYAGEEQKMEQYRAAVLLVFHGADILTHLAERSDACRSVLKQLKWSWIVSGADQYSFEGFLGGNEACGVRELVRGRVVRQIFRTAVALGQLPRPALQPCVTLGYHVEEAGTPEVNGFYRFDGFFPPGASDTVDTVTPKFSRVDSTTGKRFTIFRCSATDAQQWYISELSDKPGTTSDLDYYYLKDVTNSGVPEGRWNTCGAGTKPAPKHLTPVRATPNPEDDLLEFVA